MLNKNLGDVPPDLDEIPPDLEDLPPDLSAEDVPPPLDELPKTINIADFIANSRPLPPPPIERYTPDQLAAIPRTVTSPADAVMADVESKIQAANPIKNEADLAAAKKIIYDPANPPFKNMAKLGSVARSRSEAEGLKAQGVDVPQLPPEYEKALQDWTVSNFEGLVVFPAAMGAAFQGLRWYAANYTLPGAARAAVRAISDNLKTRGISPENADAMAKAGLKKAIQDGVVKTEGVPGEPTITPRDLINVRKAAEKGYLPVTSEPVQTIPPQLEGSGAPAMRPIPAQGAVSGGPAPLTIPESLPGAFSAGPLPIEPPTFNGMALAMRIKQAIGLNPVDALTPEKLQYAYEEGTLPQDLAEKIGLPAAVQQGELARAKEAAAQRADIEKAAQADLEQQAVTAHADAVMGQVAADSEHAVAQQTRAQELLVPEEITGKPIADMSEDEFSALARQAMPEVGGDVIQESYDTAMADAGDMNLADGRPSDGTPPELTADHEFDHLGDEGLDPVVKMDYEAAQAEAPGITEAQHRSMVKDAIDAYAIQPEDIPYQDLKDYALKKAETESNMEFAKAEAADQLATKGHATPILNMLWRRKLNKGKALKGGDLDASSLRGYFTESGGMTIQQATENAYEMGWIPENDEGLFREALDSEIMKRDGLGVREKGAEYRPGISSVMHHGTSADDFNVFKGDVAYLTSVPEEAGAESFGNVADNKPLKTDSPEFKAWFGKSKDVPEMMDNGQPIKLYHGSDKIFNEFSAEKLGNNTGAQSAKKGFFLTSSPRNAGFYAGYSEAQLYDLYARVSKERKRIQKENPKLDKEEAGQKAWENVAPGGNYLKLTDILEKGKKDFRDFVKKNNIPFGDNFLIEYAKSEAYPETKSLVKRSQSILNNLVDNSKVVDDSGKESFTIITGWKNNKPIKNKFNTRREAGEFLLKTDYFKEEIARDMQGNIEDFENLKPDVKKVVQDRLNLYIEAAKVGKEASTFNDTVAYSKRKHSGASEDDVWEASDTDLHANIKQVYAKMENPLIHTQADEYRDKSYTYLVDEAIKGGHDGLIIKNTLDPYRSDIYVVFDPTQIKSVNNRGTFDPNNPNILMSSRKDYAPGHVYQPPFYSKLTQVIEAKMVGSAPAEQIRGLVASAGVKQDEIDWYNLDGFLKDNPKPTKAQVLDYLRANALEIREAKKTDVIKEATNAQMDAAIEATSRNDSFGYVYPTEFLRDAVNEDDWTKTWEPPTDAKDRAAIQEYVDAAKSEIEGKRTLKTKFSKYQLPGGENYREVLFTLPNDSINKLDNQFQEVDKKIQAIISKYAAQELLSQEDGKEVNKLHNDLNTILDEKREIENNNYKSPHWDEPNVLAHVRLNDRMVNGRRVLFIEEVQSDWHQKGRDVGYSYKSLPEGFTVSSKPVLDEIALLFEKGTKDIYCVLDNNGKGFASGATKEDAIQSAMEKLNRDSVPNAPLKKTWHEFAMKRVIRMAAEEGYDAVAWTTGAQQVERYDLSKQVDEINVQQTGEDSFEVKAYKNDVLHPVITQQAAGKQLSGIIGKELASKIDGSKKDYNFKGKDLKIGGEGMAGFYDQMLPSFVNKFTKKWGGHVEPMTIKGGTPADIDWPVHSLIITPDLRRAAMTEGFPLFSPGHVYQPELLPAENEFIPGGIESAGARAVADVKRARPVGQWHDLRKDPAIGKLNKDLIEKNFASAIGQKIDTIQDAAEIAAFVRHPLIEHMAVVKLRAGKVLGSLVITSGKVGFIDPNMDEIQSFVQDSDEFYITHNHPSGNPTPSTDDIESTKQMAADKRFKGHVVTDHKTYTAIMPDGTAIAQEFRGERQSFRTDMARMTTAPAVVGWVQSVALGDSLGIMFTDPQLQVMSFDQVDPRSDYNAYIKRHAKGYGSTGVFLVAGDAAHARMAPRRFAGNYHDYLVLSDDGTYRSAALGHLAGFKVSRLQYPESHFEALKVSETAADYNPDDYNKVTGRWKPGMALTLRSRLVSAVFRDGLSRGTTGTLVSVNPATGVMRVDFGGKIVRATPNMFKETWREPGAPQPGQKPLSLPTTLKGFDNILPEVKALLGGNYDINTHESALVEARAIIAKDPIKALDLVYASGVSVVPTSVTQAVTSLMIIKLQKDGNIEEVIKICDHLADVVKGSGQVIEFVKAIRQLGPDGIISYAKQKIGLALKAGKWGKLIEKLNALTLEQDRVDFCKKHGMPFLSVKAVNELRDNAIEIAKMPEGYDKDLSTAENLRKITDAIPKTLGDKIAAIQRLSQLLAVKTLDRNIMGNMMFTSLDNFNQVVFAVPIDKAMHIVFGTPRTQALPDWAAWKMGAKEGAVQGWKESMAGVDLSSMHNKYDLPDGFTFQNPFLRFCEKALNVGLRASDKINYTAQRYNVLSQLMNLEKLNGRVTKFPTPKMLQRAHDESLHITFNDPNTLRSATTRLKKVLNLGRKWGLGNQIINYPGTPSSLMMRGIEYSPFNLVTTVKIFIDAGRGKGWDQERFSKNMSRMLTGGIFLIGSGFVLASVGLMTGRKKNKKAVDATLRVEGLKDYQVNITGMMRFLSSGFRPEAAIWQKEDTLYTYDWAQPMAPLIAMGANVAESIKSRDGFVETGVNALVSGVNTLMQQPLLQGIEHLFSNSKLIIAGQEVEGNAFLIGVLKTLKDVPASFMPQTLNEVRQLVDNVSRNTNDPDLAVEFVYSVKNKVPWMSKSLVKDVDVLGQVRKVYQDEGNSVFNVVFNPGFVSKYHPTPTTKMVLDIWSRSGYTIQIPRVAPLFITVKGMKRPLSNIEQREFQHTIGYLTARKFDQLASNPKFNAKSDKKKADYLERYLKYVYDLAKYNVLGVHK